ncbi:MAG: hypothetical protein R3314_13385, partial [Longimicrobiales bacterium]|nr:hypothetical protein [Longimicrobiales bacterium]
MSAADFMPADVGLNADSTAFLANTAAITVSSSLAELCSACALSDGTVAAKPEFQDTVTIATPLPAGLVAATLSGGSLLAALAHDLSFDPLRPSTDPSSPRGYLVIRVSSSGNLVAYDSIDGADEAFPAGTTLTSRLPVQPVEVVDSFGVEIVVYSPQGDPVAIDASDTVGITVGRSTLAVSQATIDAAAISIDPATTPMDLGVDSVVAERVQRGALRLDISNPFDVTGTLDLSFLGVAPVVRKSLSIVRGVYQERVEFTGDELGSILAAPDVQVQTSGSASGGGTFTVTPT